MRVILGECLAPALKGARYVFRETTGKVLSQVEQVTEVRLWHYTKLRGVLALVLAWADTAGGRNMRLVRSSGWWKPAWVLAQLRGGELFSFVPNSFLATSWTVTDARTGAVAVARVRNPFILGPQRADIVGLGGQNLARVQWSDYSWRLSCQRNARIELLDDGWELAAMAFAVIRWVALQQR